MSVDIDERGALTWAADPTVRCGSRMRTANTADHRNADVLAQRRSVSLRSRTALNSDPSFQRGQREVWASSSPI